MNRLEEVKKSWDKRDWDTLLDRKDVDWLIEQVEKVEEEIEQLKRRCVSNCSQD